MTATPEVETPIPIGLDVAVEACGVDAREAVKDLLLTDVKLAGRLSGWEVAKRIREKVPSFPVVYVTAYSQDWAANGVPNSTIIPKPFAAAQLVTAISNLLNGGMPPNS